MPKDLNSTGRWLMKRLTQGLAPELQDRKDLLAVLREAGERGLVDADALTMLEGVLEVADLQVRDIMVPRAQMVFVRRDEPAARILPVVVESGHSRFPVMDEDRDDIVGILLRRTCCVSPPPRHASASTSASTCVRRCSCPSPSVSTCC